MAHDSTMNTHPEADKERAGIQSVEVGFALLDVLAPSVGVTTRQGAGFGLGANLVGFPMRR